MFYGILIVTSLALFAYLSWRNLVLATVFVVAFLPTYLIRFSVGPIPFTLLEGMILVLFGAWLTKSILKKEQHFSFFKNNFKKFKGWILLIVAWLVIATVSAFVSPNLRAAAGIWKAYFVEPILFLIVFLSVIKTKKDLKFIFYSLGFSAIYISLFAIYQKFTGFLIPYPWQEESVRRVTSFYGFPNAVGLYLAPIVILYIGLFIENLRPKQYILKIFQLSVILLSIASIVFAESEGAYVGILAGCFFLGVMIKKLRIPTIVISVILILIVLLAPRFRDYAWQQISFQADSGKVRTEIWKETGEMLQARPIVGAGLSGYQITFDEYHEARHIEVYLYPHNIFLNFWTEIGLAGLVLFLLIISKFFYELRFTDYSLRITIYGMMIALLIHGLVDVPYFKNDLAVLFWMLIGVSILPRLKK